MQNKSTNIAKVSTAKQKKPIPLEFLPHLLHVIDNTALMNSYFIFCFLLSVQCVALGLIYCILCKPCSEDRITSFLVGFSMLLITIASECFINIYFQNNLVRLQNKREDVAPNSAHVIIFTDRCSVQQLALLDKDPNFAGIIGYPKKGSTNQGM